MIPDETVEEVRARADIVDVIGEYVSLKKSGKDFKGRCPFHEERTPSFYVVPTKGFYNCFGCGASGDVFAFMMDHQGMDFVDAVKHVGKRAGVQVREIRTDEAEADRHRRLYEANAFARRFYQDLLLDPEKGTVAREYLEGRGIGSEAVERYGLGFAPDAWRALREAADTHGIAEETLLEVGLVKESERAAESYDRFRNRIVFPIESVSGKVLGFGGRILPDGADGAPKYLNSPESPIYHKGDVLYGLGWAKHAIRREEAALLVEGYMDAVSLGAAGLEHVVAPLGTSVTEGQATLLRRYTSRVYILFDSDAAGLRATFRAADVLLAAGIHAAVVSLPPGEDPDTLVRREGVESVREHLDQAVDVLDRKLQILEERDYFSSIEGTRTAVDRLLSTLRAASDSTLRDIYVSKVAARTGVRRETLEKELERSRASSSGGRSVGTGAGRGGGGGRAAGGRGSRNRGRGGYDADAAVRSRMGAERNVLWVLLHDPDRTYHESAAEQIGPEDFKDPSYRELFRALMDEPDPIPAREGMEPRAVAAMDELLADPAEVLNVPRIFQDSVNLIRQNTLRRKEEELRARLERPEDELEGDRQEILDELGRLKRERMALEAGTGVLWHRAIGVSEKHETDESSR